MCKYDKDVSRIIINTFDYWQHCNINEVPIEVIRKIAEDGRKLGD